MEAAIEQEFGVSPELIRGDDGIFDVCADGERVYSKHETGRFPEEAEVLDALRALLPREG